MCVLVFPLLNSKVRLLLFIFKILCNSAPTSHLCPLSSPIFFLLSSVFLSIISNLSLRLLPSFISSLTNGITSYLTYLRTIRSPSKQLLKTHVFPEAFHLCASLYCSLLHLKQLVSLDHYPFSIGLIFIRYTSSVQISVHLQCIIKV